MVRFARRPEQVQTGRISLMVAGLVGVAALAMYVVMHEGETTLPQQRTLSDFQVTWVCEGPRQHVFTAPGRFEPLPCHRCSRPSHILLDFVCPVHELVFDAEVEFARRQAGTSFRTWFWVSADCF